MLLNNLARVLQDLARLDEAAAYAERALAKGRERNDEIVVNQALLNLAGIRRDRGELQRAEELLDQAESRFRRMLPAGHYAFASLASARSLQALQRGDPRAAREAADRAIAIVEAALQGRDYLPRFLLRRAAVAFEERRLEEGLTDIDRALALELRAGEPGKFSSRVGQVYLARARTLAARGSSAEARSAYASALENLRATLGEEHPETREAARGLRGG